MPLPGIAALATEETDVALEALEPDGDSDDAAEVPQVWWTQQLCCGLAVGGSAEALVLVMSLVLWLSALQIEAIGMHLSCSTCLYCCAAILLRLRCPNQVGAVAEPA